MYREKLKIDWWTIGLWALLILSGWLNIYSATYTEGVSLFDLGSYHGKQLLWIGMAAVVAIMILFTEPRVFSNTAYPLYGVVMLMLVATLFLAVTVNGGKSWIEIGGFRFQPTEFAKFATALALAKFMSGIDIEWKQTRTKVIAAALVGIPAALVLLQHDAGSALVFAAFLLPLFREGLSGIILVIGLVAVVLFILALVLQEHLYILLGILVLLAVFYLFVWLNKRTSKDWWRTLGVLAICVVYVMSVDILYNQLDDHQRERIDVLLGKNVDFSGPAYNVNQSKIAIGSGGFFGKGYLNGTLTKADFVPEQHTDFIFCTVGEEWGWLGSTFSIALFIVLLVRLISMAERQRSTFARFYGYSVASILFMHLFVNIGMVLGLLPVIGIPLPFYSYGGSSLLAFTILLFIFIRQDAVKNQLL